MFALQTDTGAEPEADAPAGPRRTSLEHDVGTSKFDLTVSLVNVRGRLTGRLEYDTDLFRPATAQSLGHRYVQVLEAIVADPETRISAIPLLSASEREEEILAWNRTRTPFPRDESVVSLFEAQVARAPSAVAAEYGEERITYAALDASASRLARRLRGLGVARDVVVGVLAEPSIGMLVALVAVLKAGGGYVPLDPHDPPERLRFVVDDAAALVVVAVGESGAPAVGVPVVEVSREGAVETDDHAEPLGAPGGVHSRGRRPAEPPGAEDLAYIIYTSGSTGQPKGVAVDHRAIVRLVTETDYLAFEPGLRDRPARPPVVRRDHLRDLGGAALRRARWSACHVPLSSNRPTWSRRSATRGITSALPDDCALQPGRLDGPRRIRRRPRRAHRRGGVRSGRVPACPRGRGTRAVAARLRPDGVHHLRDVAARERRRELRLDDPDRPSRSPIPRRLRAGRREEPRACGAIGELYLGGDGVAAATGDGRS